MTVAILPSPSFAPFRPAIALGLRSPSASHRFRTFTRAGPAHFSLLAICPAKPSEGRRRVLAAAGSPMPSRWRNDRPGPAPGSCPRHDPGSTARPTGGGFQPGLGSQHRGSPPRAPLPTRPQAPDRQLDRDLAWPLSARGDRLLVPDRDRGLNSYRVSLRRPRPRPIEGQEAGSRRASPYREACPGFYRGSPRGF
jgi:hypothetical protein